MVFQGEADLAQMPRLAGSVAGVEGPAIYRLEFARDASGRAVVRGRVALTMRLICQRCLGEVRVDIDAPIDLALVRGDAEARELPDELDPFPVDDGLMHPLDVIEDELLLAIPLIPMHEPGHCPGATARVESADDVTESGDSAFAVLASLKRPPPE